MTRLLVCGDRKWRERHYLFDTLDDIHALYGVSLLIEGGASGADRVAKEWAHSRDIPVEEYPAEWDKYGKAAGPIRNRQMFYGGQPEMVVAFHRSLNTSKGTRDMVLIAREAGVPTYVLPSKERPL